MAGDENSSATFFLARKNGNISQMQWRVINQTAQVYGFEYDYLNRLTNAMDASVSGANAGRYKEIITYEDKRSNIKSINRNGGTMINGTFREGPIDALSYSYVSGTNRLRNISESITGDLRNKGFNPL